MVRTPARKKQGNIFLSMMPVQRFIVSLILAVIVYLIIMGSHLDILDLLISFFVITALFAVIFKVLPDAKTKWKDILPGALASGILFMIGKFAISFYIGKSHVGTTYGAAGSLVVLLLWVYYSAIILYLGAEFAKAWSSANGSSIRPNDYAVALKKVEVETDKAEEIQAKNRKKLVEK